jgi:hypothetical protein
MEKHGKYAVLLLLNVDAFSVSQISCTGRFATSSRIFSASGVER